MTGALLRALSRARTASTGAVDPVYFAGMRIRTSLAILLGMSLAACGGGGGSGSGEGDGTTGGETPPPESEAELEGFDSEGFEATEPGDEHGGGSARELIGVSAPATPFAQMSRTEQEYYMVGFVQPIHAEMFREYSATRYADFSCATCHGDDAQEHNYEMPSRYLPPLAAEGTPAWTAASQRNVAGWAFMTDHVLPTIRTQLADPAATCFTCHPHAS